MKTRTITGEDYVGKWNYKRVACRGVIIRDGRILLSHEKTTDRWMTPGGGMENGESDEACCIREIGEETGLLVKPGECLLELVEFYRDRCFVNRYYRCEITGECEKHLTDWETKVKMESVWLPVGEIMEILSGDRDDPSAGEKDPDRMYLHLREYTALKDCLE